MEVFQELGIICHPSQPKPLGGGAAGGKEERKQAREVGRWKNHDGDTGMGNTLGNGALGEKRNGMQWRENDRRGSGIGREGSRDIEESDGRGLQTHQ